jgi:DNA excision repair protein ERCC-4
MTVVSLEHEFPAKLKLLPTVVIDTREQCPLPFTRLPIVRAGLVTGDYSIQGAENQFAVERKSISDLVSSITSERQRFERELTRLRGYEFRRLVIVGRLSDIEQQRYRSRTSPAAVMATLSAFEARYAPVVFAADPNTAALLIERWAAWFAYSVQTVAKSIFQNLNGSSHGNEQSQIVEPSSLVSSDVNNHAGEAHNAPG